MSYPVLPGSYEDLFRQGQALAQAGNMQAAIEVYFRLVERLRRLSEVILTRRPELRDMQLQASLQLAELLRMEGRLAEAIEVEEGLLKTHPDKSNVWQRDLALLRIRKGEADQGLQELKNLAEQDPDDVQGWIVLGNEARIEGRFAESQAAFDRALEVAGQKGDPGLLADAHYGRFLLLNAMGRLDEALAAWEEALSQQPAAQNTIREVYTALTDAGRYVQALVYVERDDNALQAGFQRGLLAQLAGDPDKAKREWQAVAALDPMSFEYGQDCWAEAALRVGAPDSVIERMQQLMRRHGSLRLLVLSGMAMAMRGERETAQRQFEQVTSLLRHSRPPKQKLDSADWRLLCSLVADEGLRASLKPYFAVVETIWG
jgi:tetratricopeptide (TPR) repeat protein